VATALRTSPITTTTTQKIFLFSFLDTFLAYTLSGAFISKVNMLKKLADQPTNIVQMLATTLPAQSTFFINYIVRRLCSHISSMDIILVVVSWMHIDREAMSKSSFMQHRGEARGMCMWMLTSFLPFSLVTDGRGVYLGTFRAVSVSE